MKIMNYLTLFLCVFYLSYLTAAEKTEVAAENIETDAQIKLLKRELEFLATKLLNVTKESQYTLSHEGHEMLIFGACADATTTQGIKITCVSPGSTANRMGLKSGDIISMFNNVDLTKSALDTMHELFSSSIKKLQDGDELTVIFNRDGHIKKETKVFESFYSPDYVFTVKGRPSK